MLGVQHTIAREAEVRGVALHAGVWVVARLRPAPAGTGVWFRRVDLPGQPRVRAHVSDVGRARLATSLVRGPAQVGTVEHLLAALVGASVDNVEVDIDGPELPILDGSSEPWLQVLASVGRSPQGVPRSVFRLRRPILVQEGDRWMRAVPAVGLTLDVTLDFPGTSLGVQRTLWRLSDGSFRTELAWARTFAFLDEVTAMRSVQLALGGGLDNALVFGPNGPLDPTALRTPDEPARHKALDLLGDLSLLGVPLHARVTAVRPGHALTARLVAALAAQLAETTATDDLPSEAQPHAGGAPFETDAD